MRLAAAVLFLALAPTSSAQTVEVSGIFPGFPHNVHETTGFNGSWSSGSQQGDYRVVAAPINPPTGQYRVLFQKLIRGQWSNSFTLETTGGVYLHRRYLYAPLGGPVAEIGPPVVVRVN